MRIPVLKTLILGIFWLSCCTSCLPPQCKSTEKASPGDPALILENAVREIASQLLRQGAMPAGTPLVGVSTFVSLQRLDLTSPLGKLLQEMLMKEFQQAGFQVVEIRLTRDFLIRPEMGEMSLSREIDKLLDSVEVNVVAVGTYLVRGDYVFINARLVSKQNNVVLASAFKSIPLNSLLRDLLWPQIAPPQPVVRVKIRELK